MIVLTLLACIKQVSTAAPVRVLLSGDTVCELVELDRGCEVEVCMDLKPSPVSWLQGLGEGYPPPRFPAEGGCKLGAGDCMNLQRELALGYCFGGVQ